MVAYKAKWHAAIEARLAPITTIDSLARMVDGDPVFVGILLAMALCAAAALVLSFLHWKDWKAQKAGQGMHPKKTKPLDWVSD